MSYLDELNLLQKDVFKKISETQIYLYCTPKCGGSSLHDTLKTKYKTIHIHSQIFFEEYHQDKDIIDNKFKIIDCIEESSKIHDEIFIIDVYRNPIERNMSYFFHIIKELIPDYRNKTTEELIEYFNKNMYFNYNQSIDEVTRHFNINLYEIPFDHDKMYLEYKFKNINFIVLHFDYIDQWNNILYKIFKTEFNILNRNIGEKKKYKDVYIDYKKKYKIPNLILDFIEKENNFNYFNNNDKREKYINKWKEKIDDSLELNKLPDNFNYIEYKNKNKDLERMNELELIWHFILFGMKENRKY